MKNVNHDHQSPSREKNLGYPEYEAAVQTASSQHPGTFSIGDYTISSFHTQNNYFFFR
jgi:hypothetical protein